MPKKTTILILILALVTGVLVFLAVTSENRLGTDSPQTNNNPTEKPVEKTAKVFFSPQNIDLSTGSASTSPTVDLIVDTGNGEISGVQAELQFDPQALASVTVIPAADDTGFFGSSVNVLFNEVDLATGRVSLAVAVPPGAQGKKGVGKIATLSFQRAFGGPSTTTISFTNKTLVTTLGANDSVLKETMPLSINFGQAVQFVPPAPITTTTPQDLSTPPTQ